MDFKYVQGISTVYNLTSSTEPFWNTVTMSMVTLGIKHRKHTTSLSIGCPLNMQAMLERKYNQLSHFLVFVLLGKNNRNPVKNYISGSA